MDTYYRIKQLEAEIAKQERVVIETAAQPDSTTQAVWAAQDELKRLHKQLNAIHEDAHI